MELSKVSSCKMQPEQYPQKYSQNFIRITLYSKYISKKSQTELLKRSHCIANNLQCIALQIICNAEFPFLEIHQKHYSCFILRFNNSPYYSIFNTNLRKENTVLQVLGNGVVLWIILLFKFLRSNWNFIVRKYQHINMKRKYNTYVT